jgi:predicted dinucleotide-binding enzyme
VQVGILGGGRMARALGAAWCRAGHGVLVGSRDPARLAADWTDRPADVRVGTHAEAAAREVVVLATPFRATADVVRGHAAALAGKVIVDITNPFGAAPPGVAGIVVHQQALGRPARWVAAFKTNFWRTVGEPAEPPRQCLIAADDADARRAAAELARAAGLDPLDCGGLEHALALDLMVPLMIALDGRHGGRARSHWRFVPGA